MTNRRLKNNTFWGKLLLIIMFVPPMWAVERLICHQMVLSITAFIAWLIFMFVFIYYASKREIVRKRFSIPFTLAVAMFYFYSIAFHFLA